MESRLKNDIAKIIKKEKSQKATINFINKIGKPLLYILPITLLTLTLISFFYSGVALLAGALITILVIYGINSLILMRGAVLTKKSLEMRLGFERKRGRPIDSLEGFGLLYNGVKKVISLLKIISLVCIIAIGFYSFYLVTSYVISLGEGVKDISSIVGFIAAGFALIGLALALLIKSLDLNLHDVNGLQNFYKPTTHQIFLDNFFGEIFADHLDPVTFLKWDEYLSGIDKILTNEFK